METFFGNIETDNHNLLADNVTRQEQEEESIQEGPSSQSLGTEENITINYPLTRIIDDLTTEKDEVFTRLEPLLGITYKEKLKEIISRLKLESRGKQRDQTIKILEACYYLGQLRETITENQQKTKYTRNALKKSLGPIRADSIWKGAERTYKIFQICGLSRLYTTTKVTFTNLERLSEDDFTELLEVVQDSQSSFLKGTEMLQNEF